MQTSHVRHNLGRGQCLEFITGVEIRISVVKMRTVGFFGLGMTVA